MNKVWQVLGVSLAVSGGCGGMESGKEEIKANLRHFSNTQIRQLGGKQTVTTVDITNTDNPNHFKALVHYSNGTSLAYDVDVDPVSGRVIYTVDI